jgi:UDP-2,3-diacylglucosamine pyrophosphatase LpxH
MKEIRPRLTNDWAEIIETIRDLGTEEALRRITGFHSGKVVFNSSDDSVEINTRRIINLQDLLETANVNQDEWLVDKHVLNKWEVGAKDAEGNIVVEPLYQVKAWLKRKGFEAPDDTWTQKWLDRITAPARPKKLPVKEITGKPLIIVIADLHLGRFGDHFDETYNKDVALQRLLDITTVLPKDRPIHVFCLGDVIESFTGKNKPDTWKQIEMHGAKVALSAYDILEEFFASIPNFQSCWFVGGNHDRITDSKQDDDDAQVLEIIQGVFERMGAYKTFFDPTIHTITIDGVCYILTHGDKKLSKMTGANFVLEHGSPGIFNCMLYAHYHHKQLIEESPKFTKRIVPPIVSQSKYEYINGWTSNPGFLILEEHNGKVKFTEYPL